MKSVVEKLETLQGDFKFGLEHMLPELLKKAESTHSKMPEMLYPGLSTMSKGEGWYLRYLLGKGMVFSNLVKPWGVPFWMDVSMQDVLGFALKSYMRSALIAHNASTIVKEHTSGTTPAVLSEYEGLRAAHDDNLSTHLNELVGFTIKRTRAAEVTCGAYHLLPGIVPEATHQEGVFLSSKSGSAQLMNAPSGTIIEQVAFNEEVSATPVMLEVVMNNLVYHANHPYVGNPM